MKKTVLLLIIVMYSIFTVSTATVFCQTSTPHVIIKGDVWMLSEDGADRLFVLPESYYAKIISLDETYYSISFNGVTGKVLKSSVSTLGYHTVATGTTTELGISPEYSEFNSLSLKKSPSLSALGVIDIPTSDVFTYIGSYPTADGIWYYVRYSDVYGYIRSDRTTMKEITIPPFVPEVAPEEPASEQDSNQVSGNQEDTSKAKTLRIIIIVGLAVPAVLIVVLLFRPARTAKRYEEDED